MMGNKMAMHEMDEYGYGMQDEEYDMMRAKNKKGKKVSPKMIAIQIKLGEMKDKNME